MSTNSSISVKFGKDKVRTVYCHHDGYLEHNGAILFESYNTLRKANRIVKGGEISSLGSRLKPYKNKNKWGKTIYDHNVRGMVDVPTDEPHTFNNPHKDTTVFYHRDRGESIDINIFNNMSDVKRNFSTNLNYYFDGKDWYIGDRLLKDVLKKRNLI